MSLVSCHSDELLTEDNEQNVEADVRPLVHHEVSISIDGPETRVAYNKSGDGLLLSWEASETLGVYIKNGNTYTYAGTVTSEGKDGDRGTREFSGTVSQKNAGEQYVYVHPAPTRETQGNNDQGKISLNPQTGTIGSTTHLKTYIPLVWQEGSPFVTNHGYVVHLTLSFREDPGTISSVTLQTMDGVGITKIFPTLFDAATMSASNDRKESVTFVTNSTLQRNSNATWIADVYLVSTYPSDDIDVFRTKYNVKVAANNGTFYNEYCSFPAQESADANTGLKMLANGKCYNLETAMSKGAATTVINSQYKVNSLMGMWNEYGKTKDPFGQTKTAGLPSHLTENILGTDDKKTAFTNRTLVGKSSQGSPTFTWNMVTNQVKGNSDGYKQKDVTYNNIDIVGEPTEVYVTFISEYAWSQNLLGYYHYDSDKVPASSNDVLKTIIFPNVSKGGHVPYNKGGSENIPNVNPNTEAANVGTAGDAPLTEYTTVQLLYNYPDGTVSTLFPVGTTIGFFIMRDPKASSSGRDEGSPGDTDEDTHTGYQPRADNTLLDWNSWRLFTNTAWNGASGNTGWWDSNCWNFFCSADVGTDSSGTLIPGLALYGAKDDASHNYNYSFSAMLYMVSTSNPASMQTHNKAYFNIGEGNQVIAKQTR